MSLMCRPGALKVAGVFDESYDCHVMQRDTIHVVDVSTRCAEGCWCLWRVIWLSRVHNRGHSALIWRYQVMRPAFEKLHHLNFLCKASRRDIQKELALWLLQQQQYISSWSVLAWIKMHCPSLKDVLPLPYLPQHGVGIWYLVNIDLLIGGRCCPSVGPSLW